MAKVLADGSERFQQYKTHDYITNILLVGDFNAVGNWLKWSGDTNNLFDLLFQETCNNQDLEMRWMISLVAPDLFRFATLSSQ